MKSKKRNILTVLLFAVLMCVLSISIVVMPKGTTTASAVTSSSAELKTIGRSLDKDGVIIGIGAPEEFYYVTIQSANSFGSGTVDDNALLDWTHVTIKVYVVGKMKQHISFVLTKDGIDISANELSGTDSQILYQGVLEDGDYSFLYTSSCIFDKYGSTKNYYYRFNFTIDKTAPTYILKGGDSELQDGDFTAKRLVYTASDKHFQRIYYKSPKASSFSSTTNTSYTVEPTISNSGWWYFYATDNLGQKNETIRVYLDCKPPQLTCANGMSFGTTVGDTIRVTATDEISTAKLYVKFESEEWFSTGSSYTVQNTERSGRYYFYAEDGNGNRTDTVWIVLSTEDPVGRIVKSESDNSVSFVWDSEYWSATLDGKSYNNGTWIATEGNHTIILSNNAAKQKTYNFSIDHFYAVGEQKNATCSENGWARYECLQCGDKFESVIYTTGHQYSVQNIPATCVQQGETIYTCTVCGYSHKELSSLPSGHSYSVHIIKSATCTEDGIRENVCDVCGETEIIPIKAQGHNYHITDSKTKDGNTIRTYTCSDCEDSYQQELGNQYVEVTSYIEYLFEKYEPYMWWVLLASAGIWSIVIGVMIAIAHKNEDKEKARKMLINYVIGLVVIAIIVVACPYLIRGIAVLIT